MKSLSRLTLLACLAPLATNHIFAEEKARQTPTASAGTTISGYFQSSARWETAGQIPGNENWQGGFVLPSGVDGTVNAFAVIGNDLYVGGQFEKAGDLVVNGLARWDGTNWYSVGNGV